MKFIILIAFLAAGAYVLGVRIHPEAIASYLGNRNKETVSEVSNSIVISSKKPMITYREKDCLLPDSIRQYLSKAGFAPKKSGPTLTAGIPLRAATPNTPIVSASSAQNTAPAGSMADLVQKTLSNEGIMNYQKQLHEEMAAIPRNPFVEAARNAQTANAKKASEQEDSQQNY